MHALAREPRTRAHPHPEAGRAARREAGGLRSCGLQIGLPGVKRYPVPRCCLAAPELYRIEHDRVEPLRVLTQTLCVRVGEYVHTEHALYDTGPAASVPGQSRMVLGRGRERPYSLAQPEARKAGRRALCRCPCCQYSRNLLGLEDPADRGRTVPRAAGGPFVRCREAPLDRQLLKSAEPNLVVAQS